MTATSSSGRWASAMSPGRTRTHFAKPQDVAFLPDGRVLIADGLDNHRVMILDRESAATWGSSAGLARVPDSSTAFMPSRLARRDASLRWIARTVASMSSGRRRPGEGRVRRIVARVPDAPRHHRQRRRLWTADLSPLRFVKLDFTGKHLYTWMVPAELPDGYLGGPFLYRRRQRKHVRRRQPVRPDAEVRAKGRR